MSKYLSSFAVLVVVGMWVAGFGLFSCSSETTPIVIGGCREKIDTLEIFVWKPGYGNPFSGVCDDSKFAVLDNGNPVKPAHSGSPNSGETFDVPSLGTGEQLLFRYKRNSGGLPECEPCAEGPAAGGKKPCTIKGPSWCDEPVAEVASEPKLESKPEPQSEPVPDASQPESKPEPRLEQLPEPVPEVTCTTDKDCKGGIPCINKICRPCTSSEECPTGADGNQRVCANGQCVPGVCVGRNDCKRKYTPPGSTVSEDAWLVCSNNQCVKCRKNSECGVNRICNILEDTFLGLCLTGNCQRSTDCTGGKVCRNRFCSACKTDTECGKVLRGSTCQNGACVLACKSYVECLSARLACISNKCTKCKIDKDCDITQRCGVGFCFPRIAGCTLNSIRNTCYKYGLACGKIGTKATCMRCSTLRGGAQCRPGYTCKNQRCQKSKCTSNSQCFGGYICKNSICTTCNTDKDCGGGGKRCLSCTKSRDCAAKICTASCPTSCR